MFQHLSLKRPLVFIDLETTGLRVGIDRIVEFGAVRFEPDQPDSELTLIFDPQIPIPPSATAVHGITNAQVIGCPTFADEVETIEAFLKGADLAGYNLRRFDLPVLADAFRRTGHSFRLQGRMVVDVQEIFHRNEPRHLAAAVRMFCDRSHTNAHSASSDAWATAAVLDGMLDHYPDLPRDVTGLYAEFVQGDLGGWFVDGLPGESIFQRGKHRGVSLADVARYDAGYLRWLRNQAILPDARMLIDQALRTSGI